MTWQEFITIIGSSLAVIGFLYAYLRNIKLDIKSEIQEFKKRQDLQDDRMFLLSTGKSLTDAIKEERMKKEEEKK